MSEDQLQSENTERGEGKNPSMYADTYEKVNDRKPLRRQNASLRKLKGKKCAANMKFAK